MIEAYPRQTCPRPVVRVVEDEVLIRMMISDELRVNGFEVVECGTADEALEFLAGGRSISIMFSDIRMPGSMDGIALSEAVKLHDPAIKIILTSSHLPEHASAQEGFVSKPYDPEHVIQLVNHCFGAMPEGPSR